MNPKHFVGYLIAVCLFAIPIFGQTVVINDPLENIPKAEDRNSDVELVKKFILPKVRKHWTEDNCTEEYETTGTIRGAFTRPDANQTILVYQFCQAGNGFGYNGLVLIENEKIAASYVSEGGWALSLKKLPDINENGLDEFAIYYSGGMHQGEGGTGVDVWELPKMNFKGLGWFQADSFTETSNRSYKVSVTKGAVPVFYREKYTSINEKKWRKIGRAVKFSLSSVVCEFEPLK